jgi:hypothetical protein
VWKSAIVLQIFGATICKWSINLLSVGSLAICNATANVISKDGDVFPLSCFLHWNIPPELHIVTKHDKSRVVNHDFNVQFNISALFGRFSVHSGITINSSIMDINNRTDHYILHSVFREACAKKEPFTKGLSNLEDSATKNIRYQS